MSFSIDDNTYYTIDDVNEMSGIHKVTLRKFIREGKIKALKKGRRHFVKGIDLREYMET